MTTPLAQKRCSALLESARRLTACGYRVFPVDRDKHPLVQGYHGNKPYTDAQLRVMPWGRAWRIGIALRPEWVALDVDVKNAKSGFKHLAKLERKHGVLPRTLQQETRSGGSHKIFRLDPALVAAGYRSGVVLNEGRVADIDIVHSGNRYLVVYDIDAFLDADHAVDIAEMPAAWYPALTKQASRGDWSQVWRGNDADALIDEVRHAKEGRRNNTLNQRVYQASAFGLVDDGLLGRFQEAAQECGLPPDEITATIASATRSARSPRAVIEEWRQIALSHPDLQTPRTRVNMLRVIDAVASVALRANAGKPFGLSSRDLGERTGLSRTTAARLLKRLEENDLLRVLTWCDHANAHRYHLKRPRFAQKWDSHLHMAPTGIENSQDHELNPEGLGGGASRVGGWQADDATTRIASHRAFRGMIKTQGLPPSCASILALLERTPKTRKELKEQTGYSRNTISKNIQLLKAEGLVVVSGTTIRLSGPNLANLLDQWVLENQQQDPTELQRMKHQQERHKYLTERLPAARNESRFNQHCRLFEKRGLRMKPFCGPGRSRIRGGTYERAEHRATVPADTNEECSLAPGARNSWLGQAPEPVDATRDPIGTHVAVPHTSSPFGSSKIRRSVRGMRCSDVSKSSATVIAGSPVLQPHASRGFGCSSGDARPHPSPTLTGTLEQTSGMSQMPCLRTFKIGEGHSPTDTVMPDDSLIPAHDHSQRSPPTLMTESPTNVGRLPTSDLAEWQMNRV